MKFEELNLDPRLFGNIQALNFDSCTPIQEQSIPLLIEGKDLAGLAQTGTGKTGAFLIPMIERILRADQPDSERGFRNWQKRHCILVLVPTRELAEQVKESCETLIKDTGLSCVSIYGGTGYDKQKAALKNGVEFVIATPGRLIDLYKDNCFDPGQVRAVVFDEADRMFDMGFKDDMKFILQRVPKDRQFLVYSATLNFDVLNTAYQFGAEPVEVSISRDQAKAENVKDFIFHVGQDEKAQFLLSIIKKHAPKQAIIFSNFKHNVERLAVFLSRNGQPALGISSLLSQVQRNRVMEQFKTENTLNILVATDVAARGLDIKGVDLVINYDLPDDAENYVHRIGRTGRANAVGMAVSLVSDRDVEALGRIEEFTHTKLETQWLEENEMVKEFEPLPDERELARSSGGGGRSGGKSQGRSGGPRSGGRSAGGRGEGRSASGGGRGPRREGGAPRGERTDRPRRERPDRQSAEGGRVEAGSDQQQQSRRDRGPRPEGGRHEGGRHEGGRHEGGRQEHRDRNRGRNENRPQQARGPRDENRDSQRKEQQPNQQHGKNKKRPQQNARAAQSTNGSKGGRRFDPGKYGGKSAPKAAASKDAGLGKKVSGFFKKLFGSGPA